MSDTLKHTGSAFVGGPIITADSVQSTLKIPADLQELYKSPFCLLPGKAQKLIERIARVEQERDVKAVSYTHLTLPTILRV